MSSKRFETTTKAGLQATAERFDEVEKRGVVVQRLKERKLENTSTSIVLGSDNPLYESAAASSNQRVDALRATSAGRADLVAVHSQNRAMKAQLTRTHFEVGTDRVDYSTANRMLDPTGDVAQYRGRLNEGMMKEIRASHIALGSAAPEYGSTAHEAMRYGGTPGAHAAVVAEARRLKAELGTHSYTLGEERVDYTTDFKDGYRGYAAEAARAARPEMHADMLSDLRASHFVLGAEPAGYDTEARQAQRAVGGTAGQLADPAGDRARNQAMKQHLQRTNYQIGEDREYM